MIDKKKPPAIYFISTSFSRNFDGKENTHTVPNQDESKEVKKREF